MSVSIAQLESIARSLGVPVIDVQLPPKVRGYYVEGVDGQNVILLSDKLTRIERRCILAEELGHCMMNVGTPRGFNGHKQELVGRRWAYWQLANAEDIAAAYANGARNTWEIAQALDVTEEFLNQAIEDYQDRGFQFHYVIA